MKVVILAAGKGTRMLPLTEKIPKVLVEINGKPFLYYLLKRLQQAGYSEFGIVVGYMKEKIAQFLQEYGFTATLLEQKEQKGTGNALLVAKDFVTENFIMLGGDNLWDVEDLKNMNKEDDINYISSFKINPPYNKYGIVVEQDGMLKEIVEKPEKFVGDSVNTGLYKFTPEVFTKLVNVTESSRGEIELVDAVSRMQVKVVHAKMWLDLGSIEDIKKVEEALKEQNI